MRSRVRSVRNLRHLLLVRFDMTKGYRLACIIPGRLVLASLLSAV